MATQDFYGVLGVARDASREEIRRAYHEIARASHPDLASAGDASAVARFKEALEAYRTLSSPAERRRYDRRIGCARSVAELMRFHPAGQSVVALMIPRAPVEPQPGVDMLRTVRVPRSLLANGGAVPIRIGDRDVELGVSAGPVAMRWCCLSGFGGAGKNNGKPGDLWVAVLPTTP